MVKRLFHILQVSTVDNCDGAGGAARVAWNLFQAYRAYGHNSWLAVRKKFTDDQDVIQIPNDNFRSQWARVWSAVGNVFLPLDGRVRGAGRLRNWFHCVGQFRKFVEIRLGHDDFDFPGTLRLLDLPVERPEIVHCHNLHGDYFDLRVLPWLSQQVPVVLTLHDMWLLTGHCAHSFDCERWKTGCGHCPDLTIYKAIPRDETAYNWQRKQQIYAKSRLYISTPSRWLMQKVEQSILAPAIVEARVIPNGVDLSVFHPGDKLAARISLGIPREARILLCAAGDLRRSVWKDYQTLETAVAIASERLPEQNIRFIALGEDAPPIKIGRAEIFFIPYLKTPESVAQYYRASDIYFHASKADTLPNTVLEASACSTPVIATAVGGIPEQVKGLRILTCRSHNSDLNRYGIDEATGMLVPQGNAEEMAAGIVALLTDEALRRKLGENAAKSARYRFDLNRQVDDYLEWYEEILEQRHIVWSKKG